MFSLFGLAIAIYDYEYTLRSGGSFEKIANMTHSETHIPKYKYDED